ncbi:MAG: ribokinase [Deinococcales bacterium]
MHHGRIAVFGSLNVDLVTRLERFPSPGETVAARDFSMYPGGKGANQAVACGKLGAEVAMYGMTGADALAERLHASLTEAGVTTAAMRRLDGVATGTADIWVDGSGENMIAIAAGANGRVDARYVDEHASSLAEAAYLLLQLEVPIDSLAYLLERLPSEAGPRVILDPAPARSLDALPRGRVWMLTPNEHELAALTGKATDGEREVRAAASALAERTGAEHVLVKAGARGAFLCSSERFEAVPGFDVDAVDTTAAGDAFNGALAAALSGAAGDRTELPAAMRFAHAAAAIAVTRAGAQPAMADRAEVEAFLERHESDPSERSRG